MTTRSRSRLGTKRAATLGIVAALVSTFFASRLVASATSAGTTNPIITQAGSSEGVTVVGQAFTGQVAVPGTIQSPTFVQTAGSGLQVSSSGTVTAPASLAAGTYRVSGRVTGAHVSPGKWSYSVRVLPAAPKGFGDTAVAVYSSEAAVLGTMDPGDQLVTVPSYAAQVAALPAVDTALIYAAVQHHPEYYQIPALMQAVASGDPGLSAATRSTSTSGTARARATGVQPADAQPQPFLPTECPDSPSEASTFALQLVIDTLEGVYDEFLAQTLLNTGGGIAAAAGIAFANLATAVSVAQGVAQVSIDGLFYQQGISGDCDSTNQDGYLENIDKTTTQTYTEETQIVDLIGTLQVGQNTTDINITNIAENVGNQLTTMQSSLEQAILSDSQTIQTTIGADSQAIIGPLNGDMTSLQHDLDSVSATIAAVNEQVLTASKTASPQAIQSSLADDLTSTLNEIDTTSQSLTETITAANQALLNTLRTGFAAQHTSADQDLTLQIEQALGSSGIPQVQFLLPHSLGGYLDAQPVGVQSVVTHDVAARSGASQAAQADLAAGNAALAGGHYKVAFADFAACYQALS